MQANPLPLWEHPAPDVWAFAQNDTASAAVIMRPDGTYEYEYGTIYSTTLIGRAISEGEAIRKVNMHHAIMVGGAQAQVLTNN